jgi:DNA mismatch repair ATPase MutS
LATYSFENPEDPFPEILTNGPCLDAQGLGHPLLPRERCVRNDLHLSAERCALIVSGSNMAGKSTFLRTVGVNAVLTLAGAPVRARRLRISPLAVGAVLRVQDSLRDGRSRFYAELLRLRRLLDLAKGPLPLLFLLNELLEGTNSRDRRVVAEAVIRALTGSGAVGLVTTHDLALTEIADLLAPRTANVHFQDTIEEGGLTFDYRLRPGVVGHGNARALLRAVGIDA